MTRLTAILIGNETLTRQVAEQWLARGHQLAVVVTRQPDLQAWAREAGITCEKPGPDLARRLAGTAVDYLLSVANLSLVPEPVLAMASKGCVNFHDGPLPDYAGLNAPVWALLNGEPRHGITWHMIEGGVDEGDILEQRLFDIAPQETALSLNARGFEAAVESFPAVMAQLETGLLRKPQDLSLRRLFLRADRPVAFGLIDFTSTADEVVRQVRALDHGRYWNPMTTAKIALASGVYNVGSAEQAAVETGLRPGQVVSATPEGLVVACAEGAVQLNRLTCQARGLPVCPSGLVGPVLSLPAAELAAIDALQTRLAPQDPAMRKALRQLQPIIVAGSRSEEALRFEIEGASLGYLALAASQAFGEEGQDLAYRQSPGFAGFSAGWGPLRLDRSGTIAQGLASAATPKHVDFALDLRSRDVELRDLAVPQLALSEQDAPLPGAVVTLVPEGAYIALAAPEAKALAARLAYLARTLATLAPQTPLAQAPRLSPEDLDLALHSANQTLAPRLALCVHEAFEAQVAQTPDHPAVSFEGTTLSYAALNQRANQAAHRLIEMGVRPGMLVGLHMRRSLEMIIAALAIQKAGGAYVPMDPAYPADRTALFIEDSACQIVVTEQSLVAGLPQGLALLLMDQDAALAQGLDSNPQSGVTPADLSYVIYTSGSTGRPKGVMVEHRNVINFFTGMDQRIGAAPGVWLAVTSLSFDISVLELFWTLARGFKVVISSDENRALVSSGQIRSEAQIDFSLYYWGNDDGAGPKKYELLLEGAKFADANGFTAVWTPERHFHAFGGPYPNPSVTGAAVAAVTKNIGVRAGSCVVPLHHPARIAEEWAVIDNLTNGRAGIAIASGWQPEDFVLRPENTPPANKAAMFDAAAQVRRLWRGEGVEFPKADGTPFTVVTQPRPVQAELPLWVTTAGNPETWREAGALGANVLTHLLGQSIAEVADKIKIYREARRLAGHDPDAGIVTLMLHTFIAESREAARRTAEAPMKAYLAAAVGLVKQYAWAFPAFKKPQGVTNPMDIDLRSLSADENDAILDFAFQRYFDDSGLFGTVEDALTRVEALKRIGVGEVACLIDYGIAPDVVLSALKPLADVVRRANQASSLAEDDFSIAAQLLRHKVTHLQCTPSMARMIAMNEDSRLALAGLRSLMMGGEALPGAQVADLQKATGARILNMYGPTETTIWSSVEEVVAADGVVNIGTPLANQQMYVLDDAQNPVPPGTAGELWIGGDGVTRGYWQRPDLTQDRFLPDPFVTPERASPWGARMYRTGDLVRLRGDGKLDFLGRADHQVKLRGYRIELGEIEAVLEEQGGVSQAVVMAREDTPGDLRLVAYLTGTADQATLRAALAGRLPEHMVPAHFVTIDAFPLTPNRKVDRKALPAPQAQTLAVSNETQFAPPEAGIEAQIAAVWARILGLAKVGAKDNFFALGGHSLLAVQMHRELRDQMGAVRLSITDIFRYPTLEALAAHIAGPKPTPVTPTAPQPFQPTGIAIQAQSRADAMARRRQMRAGRVGG